MKSATRARRTEKWRERWTENQSARKEAKEEVCSACWEHEAVTRSRIRREVAHEVSRKRRDGDNEDQKVAVRREEANERGDTRVAETENRHKREEKSAEKG